MDDSKATADNVEEPVGTLSQYIEDIEAQELEADLVLGGDEGKECTYKQGYMKRQAVFACLTCTPSGEAGFCTACSLSCHDGHEVLELWTRRHFRCDCGNSKFGQGICKLQADKDVENTENKYNQNYRGLYCTCHLVYPDPEGEALGEMLQCCICEDWFHESHLGLPPAQMFPRDDEGEPTYDELICQACVPQCSFLSKYPGFLIPAVSAIEPVDTVEQLNVSGFDEEYPVIKAQAEDIYENGNVVITKSEPTVCESSNRELQACKSEVEADTKNGDIFHVASANGDDCVLRRESPTATLEPGRPLFLGKSWRIQLCQCATCLSMYGEKGINFLLDPEDTLQAYEASAKRKREESLAQVEGAGSEFMKNLGHVQRIELLHGLNDMTSELKSFLAPFGETGKTVTSADIQEFFEKFNQKRRRRN